MATRRVPPTARPRHYYPTSGTARAILVLVSEFRTFRGQSTRDGGPVSSPLHRRRLDSALLSRLLEDPELAPTLRALPASALRRVILRVGLEDAGELIALASLGAAARGLRRGPVAEHAAGPGRSVRRYALRCLARGTARRRRNPGRRSAGRAVGGVSDLRHLAARAGPRSRDADELGY